MVRVQPHTEASTQLAMKWPLRCFTHKNWKQVAGWIAGHPARYPKLSMFLTKKKPGGRTEKHYNDAVSGAREPPLLLSGSGHDLSLANILHHGFNLQHLCSPWFAVL
jgi:hypothetical protein